MTLTSTQPVRVSDRQDGHEHTGRIPYQPALDGLRGLAVAAVVLYHGGISWATGGYLGVDAFFVLSGYLITSLLLSEFRDSGDVVLRQFWIRRIRRLLPALFVMLVGMAMYCLFVAKPDVLDQLRVDALSTMFYVMNWRLIASSQSYFDQFFASPFRHMWSLAIEEQYYLVWPLFTLLIMRWRKSATFMLQVCLGLAALSALLMVVLYRLEVDTSRLYYGTDTRAQSLLIGSALGAAVAAGMTFTTVLARRLIVIGGFVAGAALAVAWVRLDATSPMLYQGGFVVLASGVCLVILACTQIGANPLRTGLSFEPLRRLGLISYGVYLYHWPIFMWLNAEHTGLAPQSLRLLALRLVATSIVAVASYYLLEKPIRDGALGQLDVSPIVRKLLLPVSAALVLTLLLTSTAGAQRTTLTAGDLDPANRPQPASAGTTDSKVLLVGDSVAYTLGVGFEGDVAAEQHVAVWNQAVLFCELVKGDHREGDEIKKASDTCLNWEQDWRDDVDQFKPDVTVLQLGAWEIFDREINGTWLTFGSPEYDKVLEPVLQRAVDALHSQGAPVIVFTTPRFVRDDGTSAKEWTQNDVSRTDHFNVLIRKLAAANPSSVVLVDLGNFLCPNNECRKEIDGVAMRHDGLHFDEHDAKVVATWLAPQFREVALHGVPAPGATPPAGAGAPTDPPTTPAPTSASTTAVAPTTSASDPAPTDPPASP